MKRIAVVSITIILLFYLSVLVNAADGQGASDSDEKAVLGLGTSMIKAPEVGYSDTVAWNGSYVYFGKYFLGTVRGHNEYSNRLFRVLAPTTDQYGCSTMLLQANSWLDIKSYINEFDTYDWASSNLREALNGDAFLYRDGYFTPAEIEAIACSRIASHRYVSGVVDPYFLEMVSDYVPLSGEKIFLLDIEDICNTSYGYYTEGYKKPGASYTSFRTNVDAEHGGGLFRSGYKDAKWGIDWLFSVRKDGGDKQVGFCGSQASGTHFCSPALNLDLSKILFTSLVSGIAGENGACYELTIIDNDMTLAITQGKTVFISGKDVIIPYTCSGENASNITRLSYLILDKEYIPGNPNNANIMYYGKLTTSDGLDSTGWAEFALPTELSASDWGSSYHVYVFAEVVNISMGTTFNSMATTTDYASTPVEIEKPASGIRMSILSQTKTAYAEEGSTTTCSVKAVGNGDLSYQWEGLMEYALSGAQTDTLSITVLSHKVYDDYGAAGSSMPNFRCVVTDQFGQEVISNRIYVIPMAKIYEQPKSVYATSSDYYSNNYATFSATYSFHSFTECGYIKWEKRENPTSEWTEYKTDVGTTIDQRTDMGSLMKSGKLTVRVSASMNGWQFRGRVVDGGGYVYTDVVTLLTEPGIIQHPKDAIVTVGTVTNFSVEAVGHGQLTYQWQSRKNAESAWTNSGLAGSKTDTLSITAIAGLHGYQFRCIVTDDQGYVIYSDPATLTVKPQISSQPTDVSTIAGSTAKYAVTATGKAPLSYQWQSRKNAESTWTNSGQSGAKTSTLTVTTSSGLNGWQFRCIVVDGYGQEAISDVATLAISPLIKTQPVNKSVTAGSTVTFSVVATGKTDLIYQWQSRKDASSTWANSGATGAKTDTLSLTASAGLHGWQFRCRINDGNGNQVFTNAVTISVLGITTQPKSTYVKAGATAKFEVVATGTGPFTYQWQSRKNSSSAWSNSGQSGAKTATLAVASSAGLDGWQFRCIVTDANGKKAYSNAATLSISPMIKTQPANKSFSVGSTATFTVVASGKANLTYQWQSRKDASSTWANSGATGSKTATLSLTASAGLHGWQFRCIVKDGDGNQTISNAATLSIIRITSQPKSTSVEAGATAKFSVAATGAGTLSYQWQSRKNSSSEWTNSGQSGAKTANLSISTIAGLHGWQFRCIVKDGNGGQIISNVATLSIIRVTTQPNNTSVKAGATAKFSVSATGAGTLSYQWQSRKNSSSEWTNSGQSGAKTANLSVSTSAGLNGWQFRCIVTDSNGQKVYSNAATLTVTK